MYAVHWIILLMYLETVQEILEDRQKDDVKFRAKLEVYEKTINKKTVEIDDLKSILGDKEGI